jgi:hypothetical protein
MDLRSAHEGAGLIDAGLWERSAWFGVGFLGPRGDPPCPSAGLIFGREPAASAIFAGLRRILGAVDERGELRITFVEGDLPGQAPGYTLIVAAGADPSAYRARRLAASGALPRFKADYARSGRCLLVPLVIDAIHGLRGLDHLVVETSRVAFRHLSEIDDPSLGAAVTAAASATTARSWAPGRSAASSRARSARAGRRSSSPGR